MQPFFATSMSPGVPFAIAVLSVLPAWIVLTVAPRRPAARRSVHSTWIFLGFAAAYSVAVVWVRVDPTDLLTWDGVRDLYRDDVMILASWLHFIVLDLFAGAWLARDSTRLGIALWKVRVCLVLTFSVAPLGLALYLVIRARHTRSAVIDEGDTVA